MNKGRVLAIGLDGYELSLGNQLMSAGELPSLARLHKQSARFLLDHGPAQRTGLSWEHVSSGMSPEAAGRWSAVTFDPATYTAWQEGARFESFTSRLKARTVVFDTPYLDLNRAPTVQGLVNWGAHDPGVRIASRPSSLLSEFESCVGPYPAKEWIYGLAWPSAERCRKMGAALAAATDLRGHAARWLLAERLPDWDLAVVVVSELHSAIEGLWHGVDNTHPLHQLPSSRPAGDGLRAVYKAVDRLVGSLIEIFDDVTTLVFAMGGMGPNRSDVPSMVLLPELLYRHAFGRPLMRQPSSDAGEGWPMLAENDAWSLAVNALLPSERPWRRLARTGASWVLRKPRRYFLRQDTHRQDATIPLRLSLNWMPATRYRPYWHQMDAFALPSFYDGRIRVNLAGRERKGTIPVERYNATCDQLEALLRACRDPASGEGVIDFIERPSGADPLTLDPTAADLVVVWRGTPLAFIHPTLGQVGPVPVRRPGGHTGRFGMAYLAGQGIEPGDRGVRSSFDVVPTMVDLLGEVPPKGTSGRSLLAQQ